MSVSSDPGDYGKIRVLQLPARPPQPPRSTARSKSRTSSRATPRADRTLLQQPARHRQYGNLITLPVGRRLPLRRAHLHPADSASRTAYPQLARVLVSYGDKVGFGATLSEALDQVFGAGTGERATQPSRAADHAADTTATPPTTTHPNTGGGNAALDQGRRPTSSPRSPAQGRPAIGNFRPSPRPFDRARRRRQAVRGRQGRSRRHQHPTTQPPAGRVTSVTEAAPALHPASKPGT